MITEEQLREMLHQAVADEPVVVTRFETVTGGARRLLAMRIGYAFAGVALVAGMAVALPRLGRDTRPPVLESVAPTVPTPSPGTEPSPAATDFLVHRDEAVGYQLRYPADWALAREPDADGAPTAFVAPGDVLAGDVFGTRDPKCRRCPAGVLVDDVGHAPHATVLRLAREEVARLREAGASITEKAAEVGGRPAVRFDVAFPERTSAVEAPWCAGCRGHWYVAEWLDDRGLSVRAMALDETAYRTHIAAALAVVDSIRTMLQAPDDEEPATDPTSSPGRNEKSPRSSPTPSPGPYQPEHGTISPGVPNDAATQELAKFLDRRIVGSGADPYLSADAKDQYDSNEGGLSLYSPTSNPHYDRWEIKSRESVDASSYEYEIVIHEEYTEGGSAGSFGETLGVGPGQNHLGQQRSNLVRFAIRHNV